MIYLELLAGLALLLAGAESVVRGSTRLARRLGVSSLIVGLTVVALGTSLPELFVSTIAASRGEPGVALGNVVGSNIFNLAVILGASALVRPIAVEMALVRLEIPFVLAISLLFVGMAWDGTIGRVDAPILLVLFAAYMAYLARSARREPGIVPEPDEADGATSEKDGTLWASIALVALGLVVLVLGARWLVNSAEQLARSWGVSERVIGLTVLAGGTSLPEAAASIVAAARRESDLAVGNLLGSNIFNTLGILGVAGLVRPLGPTAPFLGLDAIMLLVCVVALLPMARSGWRLSRWEGGLLVGLYVAYLVAVIVRSADPPM